MILFHFQDRSTVGERKQFKNLPPRLRAPLRGNILNRFTNWREDLFDPDSASAQKTNIIDDLLRTTSGSESKRDINASTLFPYDIYTAFTLIFRHQRQLPA